MGLTSLALGPLVQRRYWRVASPQAGRCVPSLVSSGEPVIIKNGREGRVNGDDQSPSRARPASHLNLQLSSAHPPPPGSALSNTNISPTVSKLYAETICMICSNCDHTVFDLLHWRIKL